MIEEKFFTKDGKNLSFYNFIKNANPDMVAEAFSYGLVKTIYPSQNLQELKFLPKEIYKTVKNFRTKVVKTNKDIFLKIQSSIPLWGENEEIIYYPQHIIQIGVSKGEQCTPSVPSPYILGKEDLFPLGKMKFEELVTKVFSFTQEDKVFINHEDRNSLIYSVSSKTIGDEDERRILSFQQRLVVGTYCQPHNKRLCEIVVKKTHTNCNVCGASGPTTEEKDAQPTHPDKGKGIM